MEHLFVEGHGIRTVALLGAVQWLEQTGRVSGLRSITCYSFGSIIGAAIALKRDDRPNGAGKCDGVAVRVG